MLSAGVRLSDYISLGVLTASFPLETVQSVLTSTGRASVRERELPAHVMVYYAIALALYADVSTREVLRCLLEGARWLGEGAVEGEPTGTSGLSKARTRLGAAPLEALYREVVTPVAAEGTLGAWYRGWRGDESRRDDAGRERYGREHARLRSSKQFARRERDRRVSASAGRRVAGNWDACDLRRAGGALRHE